MSKIKPISPTLFKALADDPWIKDHSPIDPAKIHALGAITMAWNFCETNLFLLFAIVAKLKPKVAWIIVHDMGDIAVWERIQGIAKSRNDYYGDEITALKHADKIYDLCRRSRP